MLRWLTLSRVSCRGAFQVDNEQDLQASVVQRSLIEALSKTLQQEQVAGVVLAQRPLDGLFDSVQLRFVIVRLCRLLVQSLLRTHGSLEWCGRRAGSFQIPVCRRSHWDEVFECLDDGPHTGGATLYRQQLTLGLRWLSRASSHPLRNEKWRFFRNASVQ
jgi:hypothetical protein